MIKLIVIIFLLIILIKVISNIKIQIMHDFEIYTIKIKYCFKIIYYKLILKLKKTIRLIKRMIKYLQDIIPITIITFIAISVIIPIGIRTNKYIDIYSGIWDLKSLFLSPIIIVYFVNMINNEKSRRKKLRMQYNMIAIIEIKIEKYIQKIEKNIYDCNVLEKINPIISWEHYEEYIQKIYKKINSKGRKLTDKHKAKELFVQHTKTLLLKLEKLEDSINELEIEYSQNEFLFRYLLNTIEEDIEILEDSNNVNINERITNTYVDIIRDSLYFLKELRYIWEKDMIIDNKIKNILVKKGQKKM
ncbi:MAG: hypothetical protein IJE59_00750 [Clostridia bacterium]|nr:hypothetical protein [Clostridia bacterium]